MFSHLSEIKISIFLSNASKQRAIRAFTSTSTTTATSSTRQHSKQETFTIKSRKHDSSAAAWERSGLSSRTSDELESNSVCTSFTGQQYKVQATNFLLCNWHLFSSVLDILRPFSKETLQLIRWPLKALIPAYRNIPISISQTLNFNQCISKQRTRCDKEDKETRFSLNKTRPATRTCIKPKISRTWAAGDDDTNKDPRWCKYPSSERWTKFMQGFSRIIVKVNSFSRFFMMFCFAQRL